jgi:hypothetical protein
MKTTEIILRAFNMYFTIQVQRDHYLSLQECIKYVRSKEELKTAQVARIKHGKKEIENKNYRPPYELQINNIARQYINTR